MTAGKRTQQLENVGKSYVKGCLVSYAHKNKIPTDIPMFSGLTFSMGITFMSLGVTVTPEVNMAVRKAEVLMLHGIFYISTLQTEG